MLHEKSPGLDLDNLAELTVVTKSVALADRSSVGRILVEGTDRLDLLHRLSTNTLVSGKPGQRIGTVFTTDKGRVIEYVNVLIQPSSLLLLTSPHNEDTFSNWIAKYTIMEDIHLMVKTHLTSMLTLVGPMAKEAAELATNASLRVNSVVELPQPVAGAIVSHRTEFNTEFVDFIVSAERKTELEERLMPVLQKFGGRRISEDVFETFRISRGIPVHGAEISETYNPYEAGLREAISFTKGCYIGQEVIARLDTYQKIQRSLTGIVFDQGSFEFTNGASVIFRGEEIGTLTSVGPTAVEKSIVCIGILKTNVVRSDDHVSIACEGRSVQGSVRQFPIVL
jgi:tRNA-modifying protein YgfZ